MTMGMLSWGTFNYLVTLIIIISGSILGLCQVLSGESEMTFFSIKSALKDLSDMDNAFGRITFLARKPILLSKGPQQTLPVWELFGIYLLVERIGDNWDVPLESFEGELLYVGKTSTNVHERIKCHFGLANMESSFENHRWSSLKHIATDLQNRLAVGDVVLYCVEVRSGGAGVHKGVRQLLPEIVEKHLLLTYALSTGRLPVLNLQF